MPPFVPKKKMAVADGLSKERGATRQAIRDSRRAQVSGKEDQTCKLAEQHAAVASSHRLRRLRV